MLEKYKKTKIQLLFFLLGIISSSLPGKLELLMNIYNLTRFRSDLKVLYETDMGIGIRITKDFWLFQLRWYFFHEERNTRTQNVLPSWYRRSSSGQISSPGNIAILNGYFIDQCSIFIARKSRLFKEGNL